MITPVQSTMDRVKRRLAAVTRDKSVAGEPYPSLSPPLVTLYVTPARKDESREAFDILAASRTGFTVSRADDDVVAAEFGGQMQVGIEEIRRLKHALIQFERDLLHSNPALTAMIDPLRDAEVQERSERDLAEQIEQARAQLERALS